MSSNRVPLCIYHGACDDGFGAALAVHLALDGEVELFPGVHMQPPPPDETLRDRDVMLVDFSYKRPVLEKVMEQCSSLLVLDHHKTAQEDLEFLASAQPRWSDHLAWASRHQSPVERKCPGAALFDMKRSGAMIAWNYFHPHVDAPLFFKYLMDRDLWLQVLENGTDFSIALRSYPQEIDVWKRLLYQASELIREGPPIKRYYLQKIGEMKKTAVRRKLGGYDVPVCNAPYFAASELAGELCANEPFAACYFFNGVGWQFSLRSDGRVDVGNFALLFGGGGHPNAAGFTCAALPWESL